MNETVIDLLSGITIIIAIGAAALIFGVVVWLLKEPNLWTSGLAIVISASLVAWLCLRYSGAKLVLEKRGAAKPTAERVVIKPTPTPKRR